MEFAKGHGTGNDFVIIPDVDGALALSDQFVAALCNRHHGIGGDGLLRIVATAQMPEFKELAADAPWFMDYRNANGSVAEMCGNGVRVYARWLQQAGLLTPPSHPGRAVSLDLATRNGIRRVVVAADPAADIMVDMGLPELSGQTRTVSVGDWSGTGLEVSMGNPHVVVAVDDLAVAGRLIDAPLLDPAGEANVEFVVIGPVDDRISGGGKHLAMRVHERGVGETQSCGTGACAVAVAATVWAGRGEGRYVVDVPGGQLQVRVQLYNDRNTMDLRPDTVWLTGPAQVVAQGHLDAGWLASLGY